MATSFGMDDADAFGAGDADAFVAPIPFGAGDTDAFGAEDEEAFSADRPLAERFGFDSIAAELMGREAFGVKPDVPFEQQPAGARYVSIPLGQGIASARQGISTGAAMAHSDRVRILDNIDIMERLQDRKNYVGPGGLFNEPAYQRDLDRVSDLWSPQHPAINPLDPGAYAAHINEPEVSQYAATRDPARRQAIRERIQSVVAGTLRNVAEQERVLRSYPVDPSLQALNEAKTFGDAAGVIWDDPSLLIRLAVQSAPASATMAGGAILAGPAGAGAGSFVIERGGAILDSFREVGVDVSDPDALSTAFQSPSVVAAAKEAGLKRGLPIALFDALAGGVASKTIFRNKAGDLAAQTGFQAGTGGAGEATAQLVERGEVYAPGAVVAEVGAEVVTGAPEAAAIGAGSGKYRAEAKQAAPQAGEEGPALPGGALPGEALYGATPGVPAALPEPQGRPDTAAELRQLLGDERSLEAILDENRRLQEARQTAARLRELTRQRQALQQQNLGGRFATQIAEVSGQIGQVQRGAPELIGLAKQAQALSRQNIGGRYTQQLAELNREIGQIRQRMGLVKGDGTAENPLALRDGDDIGVGVDLTQEPTPAQAEAGNYRKRHLLWQGLDISIETEAGQMRRGVGADGKPWEVEMPVPYGYVRGTEGRDGDQVDVYLGPKPELGTVFLIDQIDPKTRRFDEHKAMIGFESADQAGAAYDAAFSDFRGPQRIGAVTTMTADQFKDWLRKANTKRPVAYVNPARHRKPTDLLAFLISRGGIRDTGGELAAMDAGKRRPGLINNATGMDLDHAREIAEEAGYIRPAQADTTTSINDLVVAVDASLRGRRIVTDADIEAERERVRREDSEKERARYDDVLQEVRDVAGRLGYVRLTANEVREAALLTMGGMDPEDALVDVVTRVAQATIEEETTGETVEATAEQSPFDVVAADTRPRETAAPAREPAGEDVREPEGGAAPSGDQPGRGGDQPGREGPVGPPQPESQPTETPESTPQVTGGRKAPRERRGQILAMDTGQPFTVTLSDTGPWDFNDRFPDVPTDIMEALIREGRWPFDNDPASVEEILFTTKETMREAVGALSSAQRWDAELARLESGGDQQEVAKKRLTREQAIARARREATMALRSFEDNIGAYADVFGLEAGDAYREVVKQFVKQERTSTPGLPTPETEPPPAETKPPKTETKPPATETPDATGKAAQSIALAEALSKAIATGQGNTPVAQSRIQALADKHFGGTMASGAWDRKDLYDAVELATNLYIGRSSIHASGPLQDAQRGAAQLLALSRSLPTQTVRTEEQQLYQQFSTPPEYAFAAVWASGANIGDVAIEPSAGTGNIFVHLHKATGGDAYANELSPRRADLLTALRPKRIFREDAEQLHNILPEDVRPTVIVMNPPFSQTGERLAGKRDIMTASRHIQAALDRLDEGGRLVAIVGRGMTFGAPKFRDWWKSVASRYTIQANIGVDGAVYRKYGTDFGTRVLVIDKTGPRDLAKAKRVDVPDVLALLGEMEEVRNARRQAEQARQPEGREPRSPVVADEGGRASRGGRGGVPAEPGAVGDRGRGEAAQPRPGAAGAPQPRRRPTAQLERPTTGELALEQPGRGEPGGTGGRPAAEPPRGGQPPEGSAARPGGDTGATGGQPAGLPASGEPVSRLRVETQEPAPGEPRRLTEAVYEPYRPQRVRIEGAKPHPGALVQSAAMAVVQPPKPTHTLALPKNIIERGLLSDAQLETVVYAGQAHSVMLPAQPPTRTGDEGRPARRKGYFIGDGTGVGKGREIAGIILDNWNQGRQKAVWVSEKEPLIKDAQRDWRGIGQDPDLIFKVNKFNNGDSIGESRGIGFVTYDSLKSGMSDQRALARGQFIRGQAVLVADEAAGAKTADGFKTTGTVLAKPTVGRRGQMFYRVKLANGNEITAAAKQLKAADETKTIKSRIDQIVEWLGDDFDGVIVFDESHNLGNATEQEGPLGKRGPSQKAIAGLKLQNALPNARIVYVSATGATEVANLAYGDRLGLWGPGTAFPGVAEFLGEIEGGGIAAMELVARDMKAMGVYLARNLSYDGVEYDRVEHTLTPTQREIYDELSTAWQKVLENVENMMANTGADKNARARAAFNSQFWGAHQRFFNQVITSLQMPSVLTAIEADLNDGRQVVLQLVNTNAASTEREVARAKAAGEDIDDLDLTPRDQLISFIRSSYPTQQYEIYSDENGKNRSRIVVDSNGEAVQNAEAVAMRDRMIERLMSVRVPQSPLDLILDHFGADNVAEVSGRSERFVMRRDEKTGERHRVRERIPKSARITEADAFQDGKKRVLVFSQAGGTGRSYHADNASKTANRRRAHYLLQAGWRADVAVQGFGRTHRTNQGSAPIFRLVTTDLSGQKRFISSIARRLAQLGALTKGQRQAGDQGAFTSRDNLENAEARDALDIFWRKLQRDGIAGVTIGEFEKQSGLRLRKEVDGVPAGLREDLPGITQFLNRLLSFNVEQQNAVFNAFDEILTGLIQQRTEDGTLDTGMVTYSADKIEKVKETPVYTDPDSGAVTNYVQLRASHKTRKTPFETVERQPNLLGWIESSRGQFYAMLKASNVTTPEGDVVEMVRLVNPKGSHTTPAELLTNEKNWTRVNDDAAEARWNESLAKIPEFDVEPVHLITGTILPIWDRLRGSVNVVRLQTDAGDILLGRKIQNDVIQQTLTNLGVRAGAVETVDTETAHDRILFKADVATLSNGWTLKRSRVAGEYRIEILGPATYNEGEGVKGDGAFTEIIAGRKRYFIPTGKDALDVMGRITKRRPIVRLGESGHVKASLALDRGTESRSTTVKPLGRHMRASYDPARGAARRELQRRVAALVEQFAGAGLVDVAVADRLWQVHEGGKTQPIHGGFAPGEALIAIALDSPDPLPIAHHEIIHLMREMNLIPEHHWRVLERAADADWMTRYRIEERYPDITHEQQLEEAVADAFREFRSGKSPTEDVTVASILRRLQILVMRVVAAIKRAWNGVPGDFDAKANLIFRDIERGLYRIPVQDEPGVGENAPSKDYDFKAVRMTEEEAGAFAAEQERDTGWGWYTLKQRGVDGSTYWIVGTGHVPVEATGGQMTERARTTRAVFTSAERDPRAAASLPPALQKAQAAQRVKAAGEQRKKEAAKRYQIGDDKAKPVTEQTDQGEQLVIPGAEKISNRELVERRAAGKAAAKKPQKGIEDLPLFDTPKKQTDLFKAARQEVVRRETHAVQRRNAMMGWIARGQPIDRAIRMPFSFMGGVDAQGKWNAGKLLYERHPGIVTGALIGARAGAAISNPLGAVVGRVAGKAVAGQAGAQLGEAAAALTGGLPGAMAGGAIGGGVGALFDARFDPNGRFNFMNPILESARIGLIDRYGLSDEYLTADRKRALDERRIVMQAVEILKTLKEQGIATGEAKVLQAILTGEKVDNEAMNKLAQPIREAIDALGQEAVHLGLISAEAFERNRGAYLHRLYLKHEMDQDTLGRWAGRFLTSYRKRIIGHELRGRGLFFDERMGRLMRDVPGWPEGTAPSAVKGQKFLMLDRIPEQEELEGIGAREDVKVIDRVFWPANKPIPPRYQDYTDRGTWEVREVRGGKVTIWRDFTKKEREQMGEILDARYTIAKTFMLLGHDLATGRFYKDISENEAWTQTEEPSEKWRDASEYGYRLWADDSIKWVKVPEAEIPGTGGKKKWGALSGKFVRAEIWRDINELAILQRSNFWRRQLTTWKKNKTARSPVVHMNNIMSNFLLMDMADVRMQDLVAGLRAYIRKDGDYQDAADHGVFGVDMVSQELRRDVLEPLLKDIRIEMLKQQTTVQTKAGMLSLLAERIHGAYRKMDRGMLQAYQIEDDVFRMAAYMRHKSTGLSPEDAAAAAREEFIDYDIRAPWIVAARNSLLPFVSYTYRATPLVARMVATRPWKFAKYASIAYAMGALAYMIAPGDEDDERKSLRDEEQGHTWMGTPQMMRMPFRDPYGNPVFFDSRRWIPAGDVFDMGRGQAAVPVPAPLLFGGPIMLGAELALDKSAFTGEPIVPPYATPMERTKAVADHVYKSWMPSAPWVPGSWYWEKVGKSVNSRLGLDWAENIGWGTEPRDALGRPLLPQFEIPSAFGVKLKPQDVEFGLQMHQRDIRKETDDLRARERQLGKDLERQMISQETYDAKIKELEERMERLGKRMEYYEPGSTAEAP